jgi:hypothetical protein
MRRNGASRRAAARLRLVCRGLCRLVVNRLVLRRLVLHRLVLHRLVLLRPRQRQRRSLPGPILRVRLRPELQLPLRLLFGLRLRVPLSPRLTPIHPFANRRTCVSPA